jgi:hypothetical protein
LTLLLNVATASSDSELSGGTAVCPAAGAGAAAGVPLAGGVWPLLAGCAFVFSGEAGAAAGVEAGVEAGGGVWAMTQAASVRKTRSRKIRDFIGTKGSDRLTQL